MSYFEDKILKGGEITQQGEFSGAGTFYLFLVPKSADGASVAVLNVKLSQSDKYADFPFTAGVWNPTVVNKVNVKAEDLTAYRIFWGAE